MISVLGIFAAEMATGKDAIEQFGLFAESRHTTSGSINRSAFAGHTAGGPLTAKRQLGAMAPVGFFDPLGFTSVGDEKGFRKLRASELKHGRVAMMASIGLVGQ